MAKILLVEDEEKIARFIRLELMHEGYEGAVSHDGREGLSLAQSGGFDLCLLDVMLPGLNGMEVLRRLRKDSDLPVIMVTARDSVMDKVGGLDLGADDYMVKPFEITEFEARVRSLLRRQAGLRAAEVTIGGVMLDLPARRFLAEGQPMDLPAREHALLELLFMRAGKVVPKETIMQSMTSLEDTLSDNAIEQYASRLRRRLAPHGVHLRTARGIGYYIDKGV